MLAIKLGEEGCHSLTNPRETDCELVDSLRMRKEERISLWDERVLTIREFFDELAVPILDLQNEGYESLGERSCVIGHGRVDRRIGACRRSIRQCDLRRHRVH